MLVLSRKKDEAIYIGGVRVMIVSNRDGKVRLGIDAPKGVPVHREEVLKRLALRERVRADNAGERTCNVCGCSEHAGCMHGEGGPCAWVSDNIDLCTACAARHEMLPRPSVAEACCDATTV